MNKLTLEHLAGYLPYGLKVKTSERQGSIIIEIKGIDIIEWFILGQSYLMIDDSEYPYKLESCKPILRPLSDLTKEIEVGGEKFVPIMRLRPESFGCDGKFSYDYYKQASVYILKNENTGEELHIYTDNFISISTRKHRFNVSDYRIIQKLYSWHFDIHNLISEGLAIDINTL